MFLRALIILVLSLDGAAGVAGEIQPGSQLVQDGIPPIPDSLARAVGRYTKGRSADFVAWHPARREMLIATFFGNTPQIHRVKEPGADRTQLTFFDDRPTRGVSYQPTHGEYFIFSKDSGGDQNFQNYRYDLESGAITLLTDGKSRNGTGVWSNDGKRIVYGSTRRNGKDVDLYVVEPLRPETDRLLAQLEGGGWNALDWSPDDRSILVFERISANQSHLWMVEAGTGKRTRITPLEDSLAVYHGDACFAKDGKGLYVITDRDSEFRRLAYFDLSNHTYRVVTERFPWDVLEFDLSPDGRTLALILNEDGLVSLHLLDAKSGKDRSIPPLTSLFTIRWHKNSRDLGFSMDSARFAADAYSLDVTTGKIERWTHSETGGLDTRAFVEPELIRWKSFDGRMISGFLYRPPARWKGPRPVVVDIHGGPEEQFQPYFLGKENYLMNELGVAIVYPNIRGSSGYGKSFLKLDNGMLREDAYKDIGSLLDWIGNEPSLDAKRILLTGFSYGGNVVLATSSLYSDRIRCSIDVVGPSNLVTFLENTAGYRQDLRRVEYGDEREPAMRAFLERIAPVKQADRIRKPLFVMQGQNDPIVPVSEAEQVVASVRKAGTPVWYLKALNEGHGFFNRENSEYQFYATVLFMKTYLLN